MKLSAGMVVAVKDGRRVLNALIFRTYTDGDFRAIPETHAMYRKAVDWARAGNTAELKAHQVEIEYMSRVYSRSELREGE